MKAKSANRYPPELRERAVRMFLEPRGEYDSEPDAIRAISSKLAVITIPCGPGCDSTKLMFMVMFPLPGLMVEG